MFLLFYSVNILRSFSRLPKTELRDLEMCVPVDSNCVLNNVSYNHTRNFLCDSMLLTGLTITGLDELISVKALIK